MQGRLSPAGGSGAAAPTPATLDTSGVPPPPTHGDTGGVARSSPSSGSHSGSSSSSASIAVFLFVKEKLLFRYPDTDPFVVDVATHGTTASSTTASSATSGAVTGSAAAAAAAALAAAAAAAAADANSKMHASKAGAAAAAAPPSDKAHPAPAAAPHTASTSRERHRGVGARLHPDDVGATGPAPTLTAANTAAGTSGGGGTRLKKKSPHAHVTMAADVKDSHPQSGGGGGGAAAASSGGVAAGGAGDTDGGSQLSSSGTVGVAPQRGMRRPASSYALVNEAALHSAGGSAGGAGGHRTASPSSSAAAAAASAMGDGRRGGNSSGHTHTHTGGGGGAAGTTIQVQHTATGSTRRQLAGAGAHSAPSPAAAATAGSGAGGNGTGGSGGGAAASGGRKSSSHGGGRGTSAHHHGQAPPQPQPTASQQQQQQQQQSSAAMTCVGIAPNVLMHLLRGALCGSTTISMVNCTFLVFPLSLGAGASAAAGNSCSNSTSTGSHVGSFAVADRPRMSHRSGAALLVVAMREPDTDAGAIANFTQCFVNILCREEHRCQYVSAELDRMEMLANQWDIGGATALESAAAAAAAAPGHRRAVADAGTDATAATSSPPGSRRGRSSGGAAAGAATSDGALVGGDFDYLFTASVRPEGRHRAAPGAAKPGNTGGGGAHGTRAGVRTGSTHAITGGSAAGGPTARDALPATHAYDDGDGEDGAVREELNQSHTRVASPGTLRVASGGGEHATRRRGIVSPSAAASAAAGSSGDGAGVSAGGASSSTAGVAAGSRSLYAHLAAHVQLACEVLRVAQCIDVWNRTMRCDGSRDGGAGSRAGLRAGFAIDRVALGGGGGGGGGRGLASQWSRSGSGAAAGSRDVVRAAVREGRTGALLHEQLQQHQLSGLPSDSLPEVLFINRMLLLPIAHLTGAERQDAEQSVRSAYSRIHPCSVLCVEEDLFTEQLQRRYLDMMGRRYAKLIPLATVHALLQALPPPRRAGSFYRSIELALLEAVQRRHARAAAQAATLQGGGAEQGATNAAGLPPSDLRGSRETVDDDTTTAASGVAAAAAATTAAGLDFLAMEIIDFLRVNGAVSVASDMFVCFTHGEVTPASCLEAAAARRRRHRLKAERRQCRWADEGREEGAVAELEQGRGDEVGRHGRSRHHRHRSTRPGDPAEGAALTTPETARGSWVSSDRTLTGTAAAAAPPAAALEPLDAAHDVETLPAALVLHMLECVVDTQQSRHQQPQPQQERYEGLALGGGASAARSSSSHGHRTEITVTPPSGTALAPRAMHGGNGGSGPGVLGAGGNNALGRTPPSSSTDTSTTGNPGHASHRSALLHSQQQQLQGSLNAPSVAWSMASSPSLLCASGQPAAAPPAAAPVRRASSNNSSRGSPHPLTTADASGPRGGGSSLGEGGGGSVSPLLHTAAHASARAAAATRPVKLAVYCAWGSACPVCEQLVAHPQCWTTRSQRGYTIGYYTMATAGLRRRQSGSDAALRLSFPSLDASVCTCAQHARQLRDNADLTTLMQNSYTGGGGGSALAGQRAGGGGGLLRSMQPWFIRPHMFITPVTAAYGVSPYEVFERMVYQSTRLSAAGPRATPLHPPHAYAVMAGDGAAAVTHNNTSSLIEPERRDLLLVSRAQAHAHETATLTASRSAVVGSAEEQGHTLLHLSDIPAEAAAYLRRTAPVIEERLAYAKRQQHLLERYESAYDQQPLFPAAQPPQPPPPHRTSSMRAVGAAHGAAAGAISSPSVSDRVPTASAPVQVTSARPTSPHENHVEVDVDVPASASFPSPAAARLSSSADPLPRSLRYGRRQLPLHNATSPISNRTLLFDSTTPATAAREAGAATTTTTTTAASTPEAPARQQLRHAQPPQHHGLLRAQQAGTSPVHTDPVAPSTVELSSATAASPLAAVGGLLGTERALPVEVLLQYVLHHLIAFTWGRRGQELDTLVRLLERNLRRLPPLLANLSYLLQLRTAGYTSASAAAAVAAAASATTATTVSSGAPAGPTAAGAAVNDAPVSSVFTTVHTRLAAASVSLPAPVADAATQAPSGATTPDGSISSPYSGLSHAATAAPVTEAEVQLLQAYEVLEQLGLMKVLSSYATWPVRTVPTRLLLHAVVNEFSDVLYVDSFECDGEIEHWDLPVAAQ